MSHIFGVKIYGVKIYHRQARPNPGNWEWPGLPVINFDPINFDPKNMAYFYPLFYGLIGWSWSLGCVNSSPAVRGSQEAGVTQPSRAHLLADPRTVRVCSKNNSYLISRTRLSRDAAVF